MRTGIYEGVPFELYSQWDAISNSKLSLLRRSPAHFKSAQTLAYSNTEAQMQGQAIHCAVLEPDVFDSRYVCQPKFDRRTTRGKLDSQEWEEQNHGKIGLSESEYAACLNIAENIRAHKTCAPLLTGTRREVSICWEDSETGILCKGRLDAWNVNLPAIIDIKSTTDASPHFERSIFRHGYYRQAAYYLQGLVALACPAQHFVFIACEKQSPYAVSVFRLTDDAIALGRQHLRVLLDTYKKCLTSGQWPGYPDEVRDISVPDWALSEMEAGNDGI